MKLPAYAIFRLFIQPVRLLLLRCSPRWGWAQHPYGYVPVLLLFLALSPTAGPAAQPGTDPVTVRTEVRTYTITGTTAEALWQSVQQHGPQQSGGTYAAHTDVYHRWNYEMRPVGSDCAIIHATVETRITIQLPDWRPPVEADPILVQRWEHFMLALRVHEQGHEDLAAEEGRAIQQGLMNVRATTCSGIPGAVQQATERIHAEFSQRSRRYDRATEHGRTQGAYWTW